MARVLVTGINGFTGSYVAASLRRQNIEVVGLSHSVDAPSKGVYACDLLDSDRLSKVVSELKPDYVVHLAGIAFVGHRDTAALYATNVIGSHNLLQAVQSAGGLAGKIILASSANVYGNTPLDSLVEETPTSPANDYAVSKVAMEGMANLWRDRLPLLITRPFNYSGIGQSTNFLVPKIVDHFRRGVESIELGNIDIERDFSDVRDIAEAYTALLLSEKKGETFNLCSGEAVSIRDILSMMEGIAGYEITTRINPNFVRSNDVQRLQGSRSKLAEAIDTAELINIEETLRWMFEAC